MYSAHAGIELYAEAFDAAGALPRLEGFAHAFGADFYGLPRNAGTITLRRAHAAVPASFRFGADEELVPMRAGGDLLLDAGHTMNAAAVTMARRFRGFLPVVVDVETGGFNSTRDALLEIAAVLVTITPDGRVQRGETHCYHVKPFEGANLEPASLAVNGIDPFHPLRPAIDERDALHRVFKEVRQAIRDQGCKRAILVGHNANFDLSFLNAAVVRTDIKRNPFHPFSCFDTATLAGAALGQTVLAKAALVAGMEWDSSLGALGRLRRRTHRGPLLPHQQQLPAELSSRPRSARGRWGGTTTRHRGGAAAPAGTPQARPDARTARDRETRAGAASGRGGDARLVEHLLELAAAEHLACVMSQPPSSSPLR